LLEGSYAVHVIARRFERGWIMETFMQVLVLQAFPGLLMGGYLRYVYNYKRWAGRCLGRGIGCAPHLFES
jgi:hypothetical protein